MAVDIILKTDQKTGRPTRSIVRDILAKSGIHPYGMKIKPTDRQIGRVPEIHSK